MIRVGVMGFGYWGPNLASAIRATDGLELAAIADYDESRQALARKLYPDVPVIRLISRNRTLDAVVIATPTSTHGPLAATSLRLGRHVLVTKPMAATVEQAATLVMLAAETGRVLLVDHTFVYSGAVRKLRELVASGSLGSLLYLDSVRVNLGMFQHNSDVVWDLAPHDLSILGYLLGRQPTSVQAVAAAPVRHTGAELAHLALRYGDDAPIVHVHVNWLSPVKVRRMLVGGDRQMAVYDDLEPSEKVRVYDSGVEPRSPDDVRATLVEYRTGDCVAPKLDLTEPLLLELAHFAACCRGEAEPLTSARSGLAVVRTLDAVSRSLASGGARTLV